MYALVRQTVALDPLLPRVPAYLIQALAAHTVPHIDNAIAATASKRPVAKK